MERYEEEAGQYVLYVDGVRAFATDVIAVLVDACTGRLVTHGDPRSVRGECDALRRSVDPTGVDGWLLLEGRPALAPLNRALLGHVELHDIHLAFTTGAAKRFADAFIARLARRGMT